MVFENGAAGLADGRLGWRENLQVLEGNQHRCVEVVAMRFAGQFGVVVVSLVLRKAFTVVHFPELEKTDVGRFGLEIGRAHV